MAKLVYFGRKRPKVIKTVSPELLEIVKEEDRNKGGGITFIPLTGKTLKYSFVPFKEIDVDDEVACVLLDKAGDLFKCTDENKPDPKPEVKTDGYVGDIPAERVDNLKKKVEAENKAEKGKGIDEIVETSRKKKK